VEEGKVILIVGALLAGALGASLLAGRLRVPGLVLFLGLGMLVGTDGLGLIHFDDYDTARVVGIVALSLILYEGGLTAGWGEIRPVIVPSISLALLGTIITAVVAGLAAVFAVLRGSTLRRRLARTLEGEAGFNDPVAVLLVLGFITWIQEPDYGIGDMAVLFVQEIGIGAAAGAVVAWCAVHALRRTRLASAGLYPVASLAVAALAFGVADVLHGSGFLAVYIVGLALGTASIPAKRTIATFHAGLGWLAQVGMFLVLGLLVFPSRLPEVALEGTVIALVVAFVARPVAVALATLGAGFSVPERIVLGWAGLRGAVPVVLATFPVIEGIAHSREFFDVVFFAVILSTVLQGSTFEWLADRLGVTTDEVAIPAPFADPGAVRRLGAEVLEFPLHEEHAAAGRRVRELALPRDALLNVIVRGEQAILPRGSTRVEPGDHLHLLVRQEAAVEMSGLLERWKTGPLGPAPVPRAAPSAARRPLTSGPWRREDGDAGRPERVRGTPVASQMRTRRDGVPGGVVALADGRWAFTGPVTAVGPRQRVQEAARRRLQLARDDTERAWWREVIGALAAPED
jgi:cell volume regulation protein A